MEILPKILVCYIPKKTKIKYKGKLVHSFTLSCSRLDVKTNTFKLKLITEIKDRTGKTEKIKHRRYINGANIVIDKIKKHNLKKYNESLLDIENDRISIIEDLDNKKKFYDTSDEDNIEEILNIFNIKQLIEIEKLDKFDLLSDEDLLRLLK